MNKEERKLMEKPVGELTNKEFQRVKDIIKRESENDNELIRLILTENKDKTKNG